MTEKEKKQAEWTKNITAKVENSKSAIELLERIKTQVKPNEEDAKKGKKIMRELNLILEHLDDVTQAISILKQRAAVYQGKLDSYARIKEFRKDNVCFELYRSKFYREIKGEKSVEHHVDKNDVRVYWETMWNKSSAESKDYSEYLYFYIPDSVSEILFPL